MRATSLCFFPWQAKDLTAASISHGMIAQLFWRSYPARKGVSHLIACANSRRRADVLTPILSEFACGTSTPSTTIWLYLDLSESELLFPPPQTCRSHKWPKKRPTHFAAIGKSPDPTSFCMPAPPGRKNSGSPDDGQR